MPSLLIAQGAFLRGASPFGSLPCNDATKKQHDEKGVVEPQVKYCCAQFMPDLDLQFKIPTKLVSNLLVFTLLSYWFLVSPP